MKFSLRCFLGIHRYETKSWYPSDSWFVPFYYLKCARCGENDKKNIEVLVQECLSKREA